MMKEIQQISEDRWGRLETKIRALTVTQPHEWTDTGSALRGQDYCDHVASVVRTGDILAGRVKGTETYLTNVGLDDAGGWRCFIIRRPLTLAQKRRVKDSSD